MIVHDVFPNCPMIDLPRIRPDSKHVEEQSL